MENGLKQVVLVVGLERGLSGHHLVHQHAQGPPVHGGSVLQLLQDLDAAARPRSTRRPDRQLATSAHLRGDVVRRATEGGGGHSVHDALFAHAKVCQLTVALCVQQDVIQLQIPARELAPAVTAGRKT